MATTTTATTTTPASTVTTVTQSWIKAHEKVVILFLVLAAGSWGLSKYLDARASYTEARATAAEQALVAQKATDAQNAAQVLQLTQQYQQLTVTLAAQNAQLAASLAQRQAAQAAQVSADTHLAPSDLAMRLQTLGQAPVGSVTVSGSNFEIIQPGAVAVTQTLEQVPTLQADLKDTTATLQTTQVAKTQADALIASQTKEITGLNLAAVDADKACKSEVAAVKADAAKSKRKWFFRGVLVGFIGGLWGGHAGL